MSDKKNNDPNKFIVDNLMTPNKFEKKVKIEDNTAVMPKVKNPYELDGKDEKYFKLFIGNNYDTITKSKFNFAALLLGGVYLIYRKDYLTGFLWTIFNLIFLILLPMLNVHILIVLGIIFLSHLLCGFIANESYISFVGAKIVDYRSKNPKDLRNVLITKGGTNILLAGLVLFSSLAIYSFSLYDVFNDYVTKYVLVPTGSTDGIEKDTIITSFKYDGNLKVNENVVIKELINMPGYDNFNDLSNNYKYQYLFGNNTILPMCSLELMEINYNVEPKIFINGVAKYYDELLDNVSEYQSNLNWSRITVVDATKETIYNATTKNDKLYLFKVTYNVDNKGFCEGHYNDLINRIE